jgi:hypothetical protein
MRVKHNHPQSGVARSSKADHGGSKLSDVQTNPGMVIKIYASPDSCDDVLTEGRYDVR